jgi:hypothetical protein
VIHNKMLTCCQQKATMGCLQAVVRHASFTPSPSMHIKFSTRKWTIDCVIKPRVSGAGQFRGWALLANLSLSQGGFLKTRLLTSNFILQVDSGKKASGYQLLVLFDCIPRLVVDPGTPNSKLLKMLMCSYIISLMYMH